MTQRHEALRLRAESLKARLVGDNSRYAIRVDEEELDDMVYFAAGDKLAEDEEDDDSKGFNSSAWKYWVRYCESKNTTPWRDDHAANSGSDPNGYERELVLLTNSLPAILGMMHSRKGWSSPPRPTSAMKHLRTVRQKREILSRI